MTPDANVLVAAFRADHPHHAAAGQWVEQALQAAATGAAFTVMPAVVASFLRRVTSPKVFVQPTSAADAVSFVDALLAAPGVHLSTLGGEWPKLREWCPANRLKGNDLPDAWLAAAVEQQGEHLVSFDRDFRRLLTPSRFTLLEA
jgi:uncharacterized protein